MGILIASDIIADCDDIISCQNEGNVILLYEILITEQRLKLISEHG